MQDNLGPLFAALARARAKFQPVKKTEPVKFTDRSGNTRTYKYAPLESLQDATVSALASEELCVLQLPDSRPEGGWTLRTILAHSSGATIESVLLISGTVRFFDRDAKEYAERNKTNQEFGSDLTYSKRYAWGSVLGVNSEEDDDGHTGSNSDGQREEPSKPAAQRTPPPAPQRQAPAKPPEQPKAPPPKPQEPKPQEPKPEPAKPPEKAPEPPKDETPPTPPEPAPAPPAEPTKAASVPPPPPVVNEADDALLPVRDEEKAWLLNELKVNRQIDAVRAKELYRVAINRGPSSAQDPLTRGQARKLRAYLEANPDAGKPGWVPPAEVSI
jgi:hypothetical protein